MRLSLPIDSLLPQLANILRGGSAVVIEAPPGAGKTTRVPAALLEAGTLEGEILVLQPRRLPARLAAERVASERGEVVGQTVGYSVRFEDVRGPGTRLVFITEGILIRRLLAQPTLPGVAAVILDEFHERHLATDLSLGILRALQRGPRRDLRLVVMSATLEAAPAQTFLGDCPLLRSEGRVFPIDIEYLANADERPLAEQVTSAVRRIASEGPAGDVLVFLPGAAEIRRCAEALAASPAARDLLVVPLHGDLPPAEQNRAVRPADRRKVILSTNVAETSVTIEGVTAVVDSGLARRPAHSPWTGLPTLTVAKISQASAIQRAGRAGRTAPGRVLRLFTRHDFETRRAYDLPEIARLDLAEPLLVLHALGIREPARFDWFEAPPPAALASARELLQRLAAIDGEGAVTEVGRQMLRFPVHPRLQRLLVEGERRGVGASAASLAAIVSEGDIAEGAGARLGGARAQPVGADLLERLDRFAQARAARFSRERLRALAVNPRAAEAAERARRQLQAAVKEVGTLPGSPDAVDEALAMATLAAFPDRVMRRRGPGSDEAVLAAGGTAIVGPTPPDELLVAVDAEERIASGRRGGVVVRLAVGIRPEWLLDLVPHELRASDELSWNPRTERVERLSLLAYGQVALEESRRPAPPCPEASRLLAEAALAAGLASSGSLEGWRDRLEVLRQALPELGLPALDTSVQRELLVAACEGRVSFAELRDADLPGSWMAGLDPATAALLRTETPERLRLPGGREVTVHYQPGIPPWIESRLQDFFGASTGPAICRGRVALTLHLLAPNGRAVQVTRDLSGFWRQHYPSLRRELCRRYPRHAWPEDGATARPPAPKARRG